MTVFFDDHTTAVTAQLLARMVEEGAVIGRAHGFNYPADYSVGVKLLERGRVTHLRLRLNAYVYETRFATPLGDDADELIVSLQLASTAALMGWAEATPGITPSTTTARAVVQAMDATGWRQYVLDQARTQAKLARYRMVR